MHKHVTWKIGTDFPRPWVDNRDPQARVKDQKTIRLQLAGEKILFVRLAPQGIPQTGHRLLIHEVLTHWFNNGWNPID
jgi:hypothetical protein